MAATCCCCCSGCTDVWLSWEQTSFYFYSPKAMYRSDVSLWASIGFTQRAQRTAFTRPTITLPKVNRFGWNLEHCDCEPNVGGWPWQTFGAINLVATVREWAEILLFFGQVNNARFHRFPVGQFSRIFCTQQRRPVSRCKLSEQNFENFIIRGLISKKRNFLISGDFRPPELRNDNRSPETDGQNKSLRDV